MTRRKPLHRPTNTRDGYDVSRPEASKERLRAIANAYEMTEADARCFWSMVIHNHARRQAALTGRPIIEPSGKGWETWLPRWFNSPSREPWKPSDVRRVWELIRAYRDSWQGWIDAVFQARADAHWVAMGLNRPRCMGNADDVREMLARYRWSWAVKTYGGPFRGNIL